MDSVVVLQVVGTVVIGIPMLVLASYWVYRGLKKD